jgi:hypothetical protein
MSEITATPQDSAPVEPKKSGWGKWLMIGCLILVLILLSVGCYIAAKYIMNKGPEIALEYVEDQIIDQLPEGSVDRDRLRSVFKDAVSALKDGRISTSEIESFGDLVNEVDDDGQINKAEVERIIQYVKAAAKDKNDAPLPQ